MTETRIDTIITLLQSLKENPGMERIAAINTAKLIHQFSVDLYTELLEGK